MVRNELQLIAQRYYKYLLDQFVRILAVIFC